MISTMIDLKSGLLMSIAVLRGPKIVPKSRHHPQEHYPASSLVDPRQNLYQRSAPSKPRNSRRRNRPHTTEPQAPAMQQIHELTDRVRMLELELAESKEAKRKTPRKKKIEASCETKNRKACSEQKEGVCPSRPFKSAATSAAAAVAGALAAAAAAEELERSVSAVEDLAMESGGEFR